MEKDEETEGSEPRGGVEESKTDVTASPVEANNEDTRENSTSSATEQVESSPEPSPKRTEQSDTPAMEGPTDRKQEKQAQQKTETTESSILSSNEATESAEDDDDVARKAALALAAVAAAASASHKSPAEAAREARAVAQSFITASDSKNSTTITLRNVSLSAVRLNLRQKAVETGSKIFDKLSQGDNDSFLQALLLLEHFRCVDDISSAVAKERGQSSEQKHNEEDGKKHEGSEAAVEEDNTKTEEEKAMSSNARVAEACERLEAILKRVEGAYDSLVNLLPPTSPTDQSAQSLIEDVESETPVVVPDLLPPCAQPNGDPTVAFFRACTADVALHLTQETISSASSSREDVSQIERAGESMTHKEPPSPSKQTSVFSSMFRRHSAKNSVGGVFRRKSRGSKSDDGSTVRSFESEDHPPPKTTLSKAGEYEVRIEKEMLGLTVENVLERTVVRTVAPTGPAKKAGAKVGSLIVKVGNVDTKNLTHFETIDELRQSNRPLQLVLRQISDESLRSAREEMGRLIKGAGFGNMMEGNRTKENTDSATQVGETSRPLIEADLRIDAYTSLIRRRFAEARQPVKNKKEEALTKAGEKLAWILTLFVVGLEREAKRLFAMDDTSSDPAATSPRRNPHSTYHHTAKDYADAAKSVSKVLYDYVRKNLDPDVVSQKSGSADLAGVDGAADGRKGKKGPPPPPMPGRRVGKRLPMAPGRASNEDSSLIHEKPLLQIGDVLQRTRTFLADTTSPPAALLRGELISFLCDVLDIDTEMELAEEESESATAGSGGRAAAINDLGSAGSLLKLIVLNCPIMRSPSCEDVTSNKDGADPDTVAELRRRFGSRADISVDDIHRLHAGNRFLAVVHRLAASRSTSARITACSLGPVLWGHIDFPHQLQLRGVITRSLHDVEVLVRKATATVLHEIAELVFDPRSVPWLVLMCERAMTDPDPQLRSAAMTLTWHLAEHLPNAFLGDASQGSRYLHRLPNRDDPTFAEVYLLQCKILPVATRLAEDRSPSVRLAVAAQCDRLCDALGAHWSSVVIDALLALLSDSDERVRCEAVSCVPRLAEIVLLSTSPGEIAPSEISILEALIPASIKLQKDQSASVRVALAAAAGDLLTLFVALQCRVGDATTEQAKSERASEREGNRSYKRHVDDRLIPLVQRLLNDSDPEVTSSALRAVTNATRSSVNQSRTRHMSTTSDDDSVSISSYASHASRERPVFQPVLSEKQVLRLLPTLTELGNSRQWRVRQSAVEIVPALLGCTQRLETRSEIAKLCVRLMGDKVDAVRKTAAECLCMGGSSLGSHGEDASSEWISSIVIPTIRKAAIHRESKQRLLSLKMVEVLLLTGACPAKWKGSQNESDRMTDSPVRELAAIALSLTNDRIANVRLNVGRSLETVLHVFEDDELLFIQEVLLQQIESEKEREGGGDRDVLFFAQRCMNRAKREKITI